MKIGTFGQQNNNLCFQSFIFKNTKVERKFWEKVYNQSSTNLNQTLGVIKSQENNFIPIQILKLKLDQAKNKLVFKAIINDDIVNVQGTLLQALQKCAQKANNYKFEKFYRK